MYTHIRMYIKICICIVYQNVFRLVRICMYMYIYCTCVQSHFHCCLCTYVCTCLTVLEVMFSPDDYEVSEGEVATVTLVTNLPYTFDFPVTVVCENGSAVGK